MTAPSARRRVSPALVVAILALLVATGSTSYAAGLARNSVGTRQLRTDAVTAAKIKAGAVGGAEIRDGAIGAGELAPGVLAPRPGVVDVRLAQGDARRVVLTTGGVTTSIDCSSLSQAGVTFDEPDGLFTLSASGTSIATTSATSTATVLNRFFDDSSTFALSAASPSGGTAITTFEGHVRNGDGVTMQVLVAASSSRITANTGCRFRIVVTPLG